MDSSTATTPPSRRSKPALDDSVYQHHHSPILTPPPTSRTKTPISQSPLHLSIRNSSPVPLQDLLLISQSPYRRPKPQPAAAEDGLDPTAIPHRRNRIKGPSAAASAAAGLMSCASPRIARRSRRRLEKDIAREERELDAPLLEDDMERVRKRRKGRSRVSRKEKMSVGSPIPSPVPLLPRDKEMKDDVVGFGSAEGIRELIVELVMWKNATKSTLWFGFGSIFFLSSCFSGGISFSIISAMSHLGILILALSFFHDSFPQRQLKWRRDLQLKEEDIVRAARVVLPMVNAALAKTREIFSGEPSMTLKVAPILLFTAKYGHLITLWRLSAFGFFLSFTAPKIYTSYSQQINRQAESMKNYVSEAWRSCQHKRLILASTATVFWNLFSVKARIVAAFISVVVLRYRHQHVVESEKGESMEGENQGAMVVAD